MNTLAAATRCQQTMSDLFASIGLISAASSFFKGKAIVCSSCHSIFATDRYLSCFALTRLICLVDDFCFCRQVFCGPSLSASLFNFLGSAPIFLSHGLSFFRPGAFRFPPFVFWSAPSRRFFRIHLVRCRFLSCFLVLLI